jgi:hypothetical protein
VIRCDEDSTKVKDTDSLGVDGGEIAVETVLVEEADGLDDLR